MRVLIVTEALVAGGAETFALRLHTKLRHLGCACDLLCLNRDLVDQRLLRSTAENIIVAPVPAIRWVKRADRVAKAVGVRRSLQRRWTANFLRDKVGHYDVIHTNLLGADLLFAELKRSHPQLRILSTLHGDYALHELGLDSLAEHRSPRSWPSHKSLLRDAIDHWAYIADEQRALMIDRLHIDEGRLTKIYNGYEAPHPPAGDPAKPNSAKGRTFAMASRGSIPEKGWLPLIKAFQSLHGENRLLLIGEGEHLSTLRDIYGSDPRITFAGFVAEPATLVAQADLFVLPTSYPAESLPTVIIEAVAVGVPVIATDTGEIPAMLHTPSGALAGELVSLTDGQVTAEKLSVVMQRFVDDERLLSSARQATAGAFAKFSMTECAQSYLRLYGKVAEGG